MRVLISGASGLIGSALRRELTHSNHEVVRLVRRSPQANEIQWDPTQPLDAAKLDRFDAIVHLSGKNIAGRWTESFKREAVKSRVESTRTIAVAAAESFRRSGQPRALICASAVGYYGDRGDEVLTEDSPAGSNFAAELSVAWEAAADPAREAGLRVVHLRIGVVLAKDGGALKVMLPAFRLGIGGKTGNGRQYMSWIALGDVTGAITFILVNEKISGPVNVVGLAPVTNAEFVRVLANQLHRPALIPVTAAAVRLIFGEMGKDLLLSSQRALPERLTAAGYQFRFPTLEQAIRSALTSH